MRPRHRLNKTEGFHRTSSPRCRSVPLLPYPSGCGTGLFVPQLLSARLGSEKRSASFQALSAGSPAVVRQREAGSFSPPPAPLPPIKPPLQSSPECCRYRSRQQLLDVACASR